MSKFNSKSAPQVGPRSAVRTTGETTINYEGGTGYVRDPKSELYLLTVSFMDGTKTTYETEQDRYKRLRALVSEVALQDVNWAMENNPSGTGNEWLLPFITWVRRTLGLRTVAIVLGAESARERVALGAEGGNRELVSAALDRADEPAEMIAYWISRYGKPLPYWLRKGVGDALTRLVNEYSYMKYKGSKNDAVRMADAIRMAYPRPKDSAQSALFGYITGKNDLNSVADRLTMITTRKVMYEFHSTTRSSQETSWLTERFKEAGMTWENVSEWSPEGMTGAMWDAIIPSMGLGAILKNLRNFDQAGISKESMLRIQERLMDPEQTQKARIMPYQIYQAYRSLESVRWSFALDQALQSSLSNIPVLDGHTAVIVDSSGSMNDSHVSERSVVTFMDVAQLFGAAWKCANPDGVSLYQYGSTFNPGWPSYLLNKEGIPLGGWEGRTKRVDASVGASPLTVMKNMHCMGGTETHAAIAEVLKDIDRPVKRIVLLTDEQSWQSSINYDALPVPAGTPVYIWNLAGYKSGTSYSGSYQRHTFGGLSDSAFRLIPLLEGGRNTGWPWEH